jgi:hypothetical protein
VKRGCRRTGRYVRSARRQRPIGWETALTYSRRYALFTLVAIAGEDDLDAPDLNGALPDPARSDRPDYQHAAENPAPASPPDAAIPAPFTPALAAASNYGRRKPVRPPRTPLTADHSLELREKLISELKGFTDTNALTVWAQRILVLKNQLTTADAQEVEAAFAITLNELDDDVAPIARRGCAYNQCWRSRRGRNDSVAIATH